MLCRSDAATPTNASALLLADYQGVASSLQVFASIGGLSLLAEHLPVIYPEVSRLSAVAEEAPQRKAPGIPPPSLANQDWVALETDELYEVDISSKLQGYR